MLHRLFIFLLLFCCGTLVLSAAGYDFQITTTTEKSNCYADGKILAKLGGADLSALAPSDQISFNVIKNGISYKQHDLTIAEMGSDSIFKLEGYKPGDYQLDYSIWVGANLETVASVSGIVVLGNYIGPTALETVGGNTMLQGTRPTLNCKPTGRVQLEIFDGKFPYTVEVSKNGVFVRNEIFYSRMYTGTDHSAEDYRDFYSIEQLDAGSYTFIISDSCGSNPNQLNAFIVEEANFNCIPDYAVYDSYSDMKIFFNISVGFFNNVKYDNYSDQWLEYRFALEGEPMSAWKDFAQRDSAIVDSLEAVQGKKYQFELRVKDCPTYPICYAEVLIPDAGTPPPPPPPTCVKKINPSVTLIPIPGTGSSVFCPCEGGTPSQVEYDKWQVSTDYTICESYTLPFTYTWTNLDYPSYTDTKTINNWSWSYSSAEYPLTDELYNTRVHIVLTDAASVVYKDTIIYIPPKAEPPVPIDPAPLVWTARRFVIGNAGCSENPKVSLFLNVNCSNIPDGAKVEMIQSPDGIGFIGVYDVASRKWNFTPSSSTEFTIQQNTYDINTCSSGIEVDFDQKLYFGNYQFIINWKDVDGIDKTITLNDYMPNTFVSYGISKDLSFTSKKYCQESVYFPSAQVVSWKYGDTENKTALPTKFRVIQGDVTGYVINEGAISVGLCDRDSLQITKPGMYIIESFYSATDGDVPDANIASCTVCTDTIDTRSQTFSFEDYYGYLCADSYSSTIRGGVTIVAKEGSGVLPYRFDLYSGSDVNGTLIGSNNTGVFSDLSVSSSQFYVRVEDQCLSSYGLKIPLSPVINTDIIFGDSSVCTGSQAHLQGKMFGSTTPVVYQWTGDNGFSSNNREITTPAILQASTFRLEISGLGCRIFDSITVRPVDNITLNYKDVICQGTDYDGGEEYKQSISTAHLASGTYDFSSGTLIAINGGCDSIANLSLRIINDNTIIEDTKTICANQFPFLWQDSLFTEGTPSGIYYMPKQESSCSYKLALRLNVSQSTDSLIEQVICGGESIVFNNTTYSQSGYYTKQFSTSNGCDSIVTLHLSVLPVDKIEITDDIFLGESYNKNGFIIPTQNMIGEKYESLLFKNQFGCDSTVNLLLSVLSPDLMIPEVFTPNGDSKNSVFEIINIARYPNNSILIFNRWGNKVYEGKPYMNDWDGRNYFGPKVGGDLLPVGTYYYLLDLGDGSDVKKGFIYLNR